jgi:16S rRNA (adenine1518-N6/adenine1519-N6)-dimethyltransferase
MKKIFAKKTLGQNFLSNRNILKKMTDAANIKTGNKVLEVGAGFGALTEMILESGATVVAVEKDRRLIEKLENKFATQIGNNKIKILSGDILEVFPKISAELKDYVIVANIPYYITGAFIRMVLEGKFPPKKMVLMVQKEVANRIVASDGKESILSISVKAYGKPTYIDTVKRGSFSPAPNVDSAILLVDKISKDFFKSTSEENFFKLIHAGFGSKRKQLQGNLKKIFGSETEELLQKASIDPKSRAEDLSIVQWKKLSRLSDKIKVQTLGNSGRP